MRGRRFGELWKKGVVFQFFLFCFNVFLFCKLIWIKASTKCLNVNCYAFTFI